MSMHTKEVEEITLSDSDDEPIEVIDPVEDLPSAAAPTVVFFPQCEPLLTDEPPIDPVLNAPGEVYPENYVSYSSAEQPEAAAPSDPLPDVLNPFDIDFEQLNNFYFGVPDAEETTEKKKRNPPRPRESKSRLSTKQQSKLSKAKLDVNAVLAKAQLQREYPDSSVPKQQSRKFSNFEFELLKDVVKTDCCVSLDQLTPQDLIKNKASQSSIILFNLSKVKAKEKPKKPKAGLSKESEVGPSKESEVGLSKESEVGPSKESEVGPSKESEVGLSKESEVGPSKDANLKNCINMLCKFNKSALDSSTADTSPSEVENEVKSGALPSNGLNMRTHMQAKIAQLIMSYPDKESANNNKTQKTTPIMVSVKTKEVKVVLKDLRYEEIIKIGNRTMHVSEILPQISDENSKSHSEPVKVLEGQILCEKTGCPVNDESEPKLPDPEPPQSPIIILENEILDDQTGCVKTAEPESSIDEPAENSGDKNESVENSESKPKPRLMVRKDLFATGPQRYSEPSFIPSPYFICDNNQDATTKSRPTPTSPQTASTFKAQLKTKLFSSLQTNTNSVPIPNLNSQNNTLKKVAVHITKYNGYKNGKRVENMTDMIYSYLPKNTVNSSEQNQQNQRPCPKSKQQTKSAIQKLFSVSSDILNNNQSKQPKMNDQQDKGYRKTDFDGKVNESLSDVRSKVSSHSDGSESRNAASVKQVCTKSQEKPKFKLKKCTVVIEKCDKLIAKNSPRKGCDISSRSGSPENEKETCSKSPNTTSLISEKRRSKSSKSPEKNRSKSPELQEMDESSAVESPEGSGTQPPQVQEKNRSKSPEFRRASKSTAPEEKDVDGSTSSEEEVNRSTSPGEKDVDGSTSSEEEVNRSTSAGEKDMDGSTSEEEEVVVVNRSMSSEEKDVDGSTSEEEEVNRSTSPEFEEVAQSLSPELTKRSETTESQLESPEVQEVNGSLTSPDYEEECQIREGNRSKSVDDDASSTSKSPSPVFRHGKRSKSYEDDNEAPKKKRKPDNSSRPIELTSSVYDVPVDSFTSASVLHDLLSVDGANDFSSCDKDVRQKSIQSVSTKKVPKNSYNILAKQIFGLSTTQKLALENEILPFDGISNLKLCDIDSCSYTNNMITVPSKIKQKRKNSKIRYTRFKMKVFDVESIPISGKLHNAYHLDGNGDSDESDDEILTEKKARLETNSKQAPKKISSLSKSERRSSRSLIDSAHTECSIILTDFVVDKAVSLLSPQRSSGSKTVDEKHAISEAKPVSSLKPVDSIMDEKLRERKPIIKVIRLNYEKVKDGVSVLDMTRALSATSRSTSVNRRKQGKPRKYGFDINSRNGGPKNSSKLVSDLHFMVRNPKKKTK